MPFIRIASSIVYTKVQRIQQVNFRVEFLWQVEKIPKFWGEYILVLLKWDPNFQALSQVTQHNTIYKMPIYLHG
jgi:hypothetical protein